MLSNSLNERFIFVVSWLADPYPPLVWHIDLIVASCFSSLPDSSHQTQTTCWDHPKMTELYQSLGKLFFHIGPNTLQHLSSPFNAVYTVIIPIHQPVLCKRSGHWHDIYISLLHMQGHVILGKEPSETTSYWRHPSNWVLHHFSEVIWRSYWRNWS